ncbi:PEP-CTERM sorting domain-containing protein [Desulfomicrobium escambiense]|uniref:PEP-CTERM sorting domain-containing protein n=1 Tax=Desulfomicrobium escambiense TaxID=29503 RepID=UPI00048CF5D0|nr:PEP-CTERM sorting domain-containing protein [Desulfomicrobium escambiense]
MRSRLITQIFLHLTKVICSAVLIFSMLGTSPARASVLWDQPLSTSDTNAYVDQEFQDFTTFSSYIADDFVNTVPWDISTIFIPGSGWNGFSSLELATSLNFAIYADAAGLPAGIPPAAGTWNLSIAPDDAQIALSTGADGYLSNVTLNLSTDVNVAAGHWWLVFWPEMNFGSYGQYGRQPSDTTNEEAALFINPGGGFSYGTGWQDLSVIGFRGGDVAFRLEGDLGTNNAVPEPTTMLLVGIGLAGIGLVRRSASKLGM